ncbi:MAG: thiol-disulfide isomerase/thioredoxin [Oleiphilaceae bacterium]|jgi:thiol-disulfide isomerase/thioredoxin
MNVQLKIWTRRVLLFVSFGLSTLINASSNETAATDSASLKPFTKHSLGQITADRQGQAFIMVLWSIDCPPCLKELEYFQALKAHFTKTNIVFISTDSPDDGASIQQILVDNELQTLDSWIFSDSLPERLRYKIDPNWYGELPRTYFYEADHTRRAHSGMLTHVELKQWLTKNALAISLKRIN